MWHPEEVHRKIKNQPDYYKCTACSMRNENYWNPTWIIAFPNGDKYHNGTRFLVSPTHQRNFDNLLESLTKRLEPSFGAVRQVYSPFSGRTVRCLRDLKPNHKYVAAGKEKLQRISSGYLTSEEKFKKRHKCKHKTRSRHHLEDSKQITVIDDYSKISARYFADAERHRKGTITVFVHRNGDFYTRPIRLVLTEKERCSLLWWGPTIQTISQRLNIGSIRAFYTRDGEEVHTPCHLKNGRAYVAVGRLEKFINVPYKSPDGIPFACCLEKESIRCFVRSLPQYCIDHGIYDSKPESTNRDLEIKEMISTDQKETNELNESKKEGKEINEKRKKFDHVPLFSENNNTSSTGRKGTKIGNKKDNVEQTVIKEEKELLLVKKNNNNNTSSTGEGTKIENKKDNVEQTLIKEEKESQLTKKKCWGVVDVENESKPLQSEEQRNICGQIKSINEQKTQIQGIRKNHKINGIKKDNKLIQIEENQKECVINIVKDEKKTEDNIKEIKKTKRESKTKRCFSSPCICWHKSSISDIYKIKQTSSREMGTQTEGLNQYFKINVNLTEEKTQTEDKNQHLKIDGNIREIETKTKDENQYLKIDLIKDDEKDPQTEDKREVSTCIKEETDHPKTKTCFHCLPIFERKHSLTDKEQNINSETQTKDENQYLKIDQIKEDEKEPQTEDKREVSTCIKEETEHPKTKTCFHCLPICARKNSQTDKEQNINSETQTKDENQYLKIDQIKDDEKEPQIEDKREVSTCIKEETEHPKTKTCFHCLPICARKHSQTDKEQNINSEINKYNSNFRENSEKPRKNLKIETREKANQTYIDEEFSKPPTKSHIKETLNQPFKWDELPKEKANERKTEERNRRKLGKIIIRYKRIGKIKSAPEQSKFCSKNCCGKKRNKRMLCRLHKRNQPRPLWINYFKKKRVNNTGDEKAKQEPNPSYWAKKWRVKRNLERWRYHNKASKQCSCHCHWDSYYFGYIDEYDSSQLNFKDSVLPTVNDKSEHTIIMDDKDSEYEMIMRAEEGSTFMEPVIQTKINDGKLQSVTRNDVQILQVIPNNRPFSKCLSNRHESDSTLPYDAIIPEKRKKTVENNAYIYGITKGDHANEKYENGNSENIEKKEVQVSRKGSYPIYNFYQECVQQDEKLGILRKIPEATSKAREESDLESVCSNTTFTLNQVDIMKNEDDILEEEELIEGAIKKDDTSARNVPNPSSGNKLKPWERKIQVDGRDDTTSKRWKNTYEETVGTVAIATQTDSEKKMTEEDLALEQEYLKEGFEDYIETESDTGY